MDSHDIALIIERLGNISIALDKIATAVSELPKPQPPVVSIKLEPGASDEEIKRVAEIMASVAQRRNART